MTASAECLFCSFFPYSCHGNVIENEYTLAYLIIEFQGPNTRSGFDNSVQEM
jgi:hypothetical protein